MKKESTFTNLFILFIILIVLGFFYRRFEDKRIREEEKDDYSKIQEYLFNDTDLRDSKKPILWIHIPYEYNSRNWQSFGSRSSMNLNQPYLYLTAKSIIQQCKDSFRICMIDDNSFDKIIPGWSVNMKLISNPISNNMSQLAMTKLIHIYGGITVPLSFLCMKNLIDMYNRGTVNGKMFVCQNINRNITSTDFEFYPDIHFMGAEKENPVVADMIDFIQRKISRDYTAASIFLGDFNRWINKRIEQNKVMMINGIEVGIKNMEDQPIYLEDLLSENFIDFYSNMYGIWIPSADILKMRKYEWFGRLSEKQVLEANTMLSKYILLANAPDEINSVNGSKIPKSGVIEPMKPNPNWIGFWAMPNQEPNWGLMPNYLGNNLLMSNTPP